MDVTTVTIDKSIKHKLDKRKIHSRESYNEVIARLLSGKGNKADNSKRLNETVEILSDPEIMRSLAKSVEDIRKGRTYSIDEV